MPRSTSPRMNSRFHFTSFQERQKKNRMSRFDSEHQEGREEDENRFMFNIDYSDYDHVIEEDFNSFSYQENQDLNQDQNQDQNQPLHPPFPQNPPRDLFPVPLIDPLASGHLSNPDNHEIQKIIDKAVDQGIRRGINQLQANARKQQLLQSNRSNMLRSRHESFFHVQSPPDRKSPMFEVPQSIRSTLGEAKISFLSNQVKKREIDQEILPFLQYELPKVSSSPLRFSSYLMKLLKVGNVLEKPKDSFERVLRSLREMTTDKGKRNSGKMSVPISGALNAVKEILRYFPSFSDKYRLREKEVEGTSSSAWTCPSGEDLAQLLCLFGISINNQREYELIKCACEFGACVESSFKEQIRILNRRLNEIEKINKKEDEGYDYEYDYDENNDDE